MKITILPFDKKEDAPDKIKLYNIIKRCEEDLRMLYPLQEVQLHIKVYPSYIAFNQAPKIADKLCEKEETMTITVASYPMHASEKIYAVITERLCQIKAKVRYS